MTPIDPSRHNKFILRQRFKLVINHYEFTLPGPDGREDPSQPVAFVEQKMFKFKEDIRFYTDDTKSVEVMRIKARQRFDPRAKYDVTDAEGATIGQIQKVFGKSLIRSTYRLFGPEEEELAIAQERSLGIALVRRLVGWIPVIGEFADWLPFAYHFDFLRGDTVLGSNTRRFGSFRDVYTIDLTDDPERTLDRRLVLALAVGQDALQAR